MREVGRIQCGYFPTPDRVVEWIAKMLTPEVGDWVVTVVDAGCGTGKAIADLRGHWLKDYPTLNCKLLGVELDKGRAEEADKTFKETGGECLWSAIEDACLGTDAFMADNFGCSLLFFNPPYDRVRGYGRTGMDLLRNVVEWPMRNDGHIVLIVPDYVLEDPDTGVGQAIERNYTILRRMRFPDPEYEVFKQCVVIARRRGRALNSNLVPHPTWAEGKEKWPAMDDKGSPKEIKIAAVEHAVRMKRMKLGIDVVRDFVDNSPLRGQLLMDAIADAPRVGRPPLGLSSGHLALALAGGLCDGIIENGPTDRFLVKGSLKTCIKKHGTKNKTNIEGEVTQEIDLYRTKYSMNVRCLRSDGSIEEFTSDEKGEDLEAALNKDGDDDGSSDS